MHWIAVYARCDPGTGVADEIKTRINDRDVFRCNRRQSALVKIAPLEVREIERAVMNQRPADAGAILRLSQRKLLPRKLVRGVEALVPKEAEEIAVNLLPPLRVTTFTNPPSARPSSSLCSRSDHLDFLHGVQPEIDAAKTSCVVVCGQPVDNEVVRQIALASKGDPCPGTAEVSAYS